MKHVQLFDYLNESGDKFHAHAAESELGRYGFEIYEGLRGLRDLECAWRELEGGADLWAKYDLYAAYVSAAEAERKFFFIRIFDENATMSIVPVCFKREALWRWLDVGVIRLVDSAARLELADFPMDGRADCRLVGNAMTTAIRALPVRWELCYWPRVTKSSNAFKIGKALDSSSTWLEEGMGCNWFNVVNRFDELSSRFSPNLRQNLRKARKRIAKMGKFEVFVWDDPNDLLNALACHIKLEAAGWKGKGGSSISSSQEAIALYYELLWRANQKLRPRIYVLKLNEAVIASHVSVYVSGVLHILKITYDESYAKLSPGQLLLEEALRMSCADSELRAVNLLTDMEWHATWRPEREPVFRFVLFRSKVVKRLFSIYAGGQRKS